MNNPGRYLTLLPPINGATEFSGTPYFTQNPGDQFKAWDASVTFDWMPKDYITFLWEVGPPRARRPFLRGPGRLYADVPFSPTGPKYLGTPGMGGAGIYPG